jgi:hypothetical protein
MTTILDTIVVDESSTTIQITINQMTSENSEMTVANPCNLQDIKTEYKKETTSHYKFYRHGCEDHLLDNELFTVDTVLFALPITPIPDNETLKEFVTQVINGTFTEDQINMYGNISDWNVSLITDMSNLFKDATDFNESLTNWDVQLILHTLFSF